MPATSLERPERRRYDVGTTSQRWVGSEYQAILVFLVETYLQQKEEIRIPGYCQIFRNDRPGNSGSIMLAAKEKVKTIALEVAQEKELDKACGYC